MKGIPWYKKRNSGLWMLKGNLRRLQTLLTELRPVLTEEEHRTLRRVVRELEPLITNYGSNYEDAKRYHTQP